MTRPAPLLAVLVLLAGCATVPPLGPPPAPQDSFWQALSVHCGKAYPGQLVSDEAADAEMRGMAMVMHVRECSADQIKVPFHIQRADGSWDRSRTWVLTRTAAGLRLKHDHRHEDGSSDSLTLYGGDTASAGSATAQDFPVDAESIALFKTEGRTASLTNVWRVEVEPGRFAYQLSRQPPQSRRFRVEFDLARPIPTPPEPWGD